MRSFSDLSRQQIPSPGTPDTTLYRTFGIERLFQLLVEKKLTLLEPGMWEDPYERALQNLVSGNDVASRPGVFGLCWTTKGRSDALWRIYSPNKLGVRISTTVGRLVSVLNSANAHRINTDNLFLGRVTYLPESTNRRGQFDFGRYPLGLTREDFDRNIFTISDAIQDMADAAASSKSHLPRNIAKALFLKRTAFDHEKEVRLLYIDPTISAETASVTKNGLLKLDIDPVSLIRGIQFDPRLSDDIFQSMRSTLQTVLGTREIRITKSTLYKDPQQIIATRKK